MVNVAPNSSDGPQPTPRTDGVRAVVAASGSGDTDARKPSASTPESCDPTPASVEAVRPGRSVVGEVGSSNNYLQAEPSEPSAEAASGGPAVGRGSAARLLEYLQNTVTRENGFHGHGSARYQVAKCGCDCWFCAECYEVKGYKLRARLIPILQTFRGIMMLSLTVDPTLFACPLDAYLYLCDERCVSKTMQDLRRAKCVHSGRYFCVLEWQERTEQTHFHVLIDATFVAFELLLRAWSKHRPASAGPVVGTRPSFGTVVFSKRNFEGGAVHAARYATKYLVKVPDYGFPSWLLDMGDERRVRRYTASKRFWGTEPQPKVEPKKKRQTCPKKYRERIEDCGDTFNIFAKRETVNDFTGEIDDRLIYIGRVFADDDLLSKINDGENPKRRRRRDVSARSLDELTGQLERVTDQPVRWIHGGPRPKYAMPLPPNIHGIPGELEDGDDLAH